MFDNDDDDLEIIQDNPKPPTKPPKNNIMTSFGGIIGTQGQGGKGSIFSQHNNNTQDDDNNDHNGDDDDLEPTPRTINRLHASTSANPNKSNSRTSQPTSKEGLLSKFLQPQSKQNPKTKPSSTSTINKNNRTNPTQIDSDEDIICLDDSPIPTTKSNRQSKSQAPNDKNSTSTPAPAQKRPFHSIFDSFTTVTSNNNANIISNHNSTQNPNPTQLPHHNSNTMSDDDDIIVSDVKMNTTIMSQGKNNTNANSTTTNNKNSKSTRKSTQTPTPTTTQSKPTQNIFAFIQNQPQPSRKVQQQSQSNSNNCTQNNNLIRTHSIISISSLNDINSDIDIVNGDDIGENALVSQINNQDQNNFNNDVGDDDDDDGDRVADACFDPRTDDDITSDKDNIFSTDGLGRYESFRRSNRQMDDDDQNDDDDDQNGPISIHDDENDWEMGIFNTSPNNFDSLLEPKVYNDSSDEDSEDDIQHKPKRTRHGDYEDDDELSDHF